MSERLRALSAKRVIRKLEKAGFKGSIKEEVMFLLKIPRLEELRWCPFMEKIFLSEL